MCHYCGHSERLPDHCPECGGALNFIGVGTQKVQEELEAREYEASAGGGAVKVTVSGKKEVLSVKLDPEVVDPDDIEMLEDLIVAATNEAFRQMEEDSASAMSKFTGGLGGLGGGFPF